ADRDHRPRRRGRPGRNRRGAVPGRAGRRRAARCRPRPLGPRGHPLPAGAAPDDRPAHPRCPRRALRGRDRRRLSGPPVRARPLRARGRAPRRGSRRGPRVDHCPLHRAARRSGGRRLRRGDRDLLGGGARLPGGLDGGSPPGRPERALRRVDRELDQRRIPGLRRRPRCDRRRARRSGGRPAAVRGGLRPRARAVAVVLRRRRRGGGL
ncbi:MAG: hypothetical protein AVDCRST_MAG38-1309, partial [uncultured Solirubrobacteraceae bacterium]